MVLACGWAAAVDAAARLARSPGNQTTKEISMQLYQQYSVNFYSDGSDTLTFKLTDPPLNLDITGSEASALEDAQFRPVSNVVASPFLKECTLDGNEVTATFSADLPEVDISQQKAKYGLSFTLVF